MVAYTDTLVGRTLAHLQKLRLRQNTLFIFIGDKGTGRTIVSRFKGKAYPGGKAYPSDRGSHVPMIASWPAVIKPIGKGAKSEAGGTKGGRLCHDLIDFSDFLPTFADAAGCKTPVGATEGSGEPGGPGPGDSGSGGVVLDGRSFLPQLKGQTGNPRDWIYSFYQSKMEKRIYRWARDKHYKLYSDGNFYDVLADLDEHKPLPVDSITGNAKAAYEKLAKVLSDKQAHTSAANSLKLEQQSKQVLKPAAKIGGKSQVQAGGKGRKAKSKSGTKGKGKKEKKAKPKK
jgi:arylsulfatase A